MDDGGLPRHIITGGTTHHVETRLDFSKDLLTIFAEARPETGTPTEVAAMNYHAQHLHPSYKPDGAAANYTLNGLPGMPPDLDGYNTLPMIVEHFNAHQLAPSGEVGLHPQLMFFDVTRSNGVNVGWNRIQTAAPGRRVRYQWYAGEVTPDANALGVATPIEFGATNLSSSDPIKHANKGAIGAQIIEPRAAAWSEDATSRARATVTKADGGSFREFVLMFQNDVNLRMGAATGTAVENIAGEEDAEDLGQKALKYRSEPLWKRMGYTQKLLWKRRTGTNTRTCCRTRRCEATGRCRSSRHGRGKGCG